MIPIRKRKSEMISGGHPHTEAIAAIKQRKLNPDAAQPVDAIN